MKYYAVQKGLTPGIYTDWNKCRAQVSGVPGAVFKSFNTLAEAEKFLGKNGYDPNPKKKANKSSPEARLVPRGYVFIKKGRSSAIALALLTLRPKPFRSSKRCRRVGW